MSITERVCPVCGKPFSKHKEDGSVENASSYTVCSRCSTLYHDECWEKLERCAVMGCRCTHAESVSSSVKMPDMIKCTGCGEDNPYRASLCAKCGAVLPGRSVSSVFTSCAGWQADDDRELCLKADTSWKESTAHLYNGDFEYWLRERGFNELADKAEQARRKNVQRSVGLESFLESSGFVDKPVIQLSTDTLNLEGAVSEIDTVVDISNSGRGYLYGTLKADADWIIAQPQEFAGNRQRIIVTVDMSALSSDNDEGHIDFKTVGGDRRVLVRAARISVAGAVSLYREGSFFKARALGRKLMENRIAVADAAAICAACCLKEENFIGASSDLRLLSGVCKEIPADIASSVYKWVKDSPSQTSGLEKEVIYAALAKVVEDSDKIEIKKTLARACLDRASQSVDSGSADGSMWMGDGEASDSIVNALSQAESLDPALAAEISSVRKRLGSSRRSGGGMLWGAAAVVLLACLGVGGIFYMQGHSSYDLLSFGSSGSTNVDLVNGNFTGDIERLRIEYQNSSADESAVGKYAAALIGLAKEASDIHNYSVADTYMERALKIALDSSASTPKIRSAAAARVMNWVNSLKEKGLQGEAYLRCCQALELEPENADASAVSEELGASQKNYADLINGVRRVFSSGSAVISAGQADSSSESAALARLLSKIGVKVFSGSMCALCIDINGDGVRDLIVAGSDLGPAAEESSKNAGKTKKTASVPAGEYAVYSWKGIVMVPLERGKVAKGSHVVNMMSGEISSNGREDAAIIWNVPSSPDVFYNFFIGCGRSGFFSEMYSENLPIELADRDSNGRSEIWVSRPGEGGTGGDPVYIPSPYSWGTDGFSKSRGNFSAFYREVIKGLEDQLKSNPHPDGSDLNRTYRLERKKAIEELQDRMGTSVKSDSSSGSAAASKDVKQQ